MQAAMQFQQPRFAEVSCIQHAMRMVVGGGFEPPKALPTDLQSVPFDHSGTPPNFMEPTEGIEPPTR